MVNEQTDEIPKTVYRYRKFSKQSLDILTDIELYSSPAVNMNDPLDCQFDIRSEMERTLLRLFNSSYINKGQYNRIVRLKEKLLAKKNEKSGKVLTHIEHTQDNLKRNTGIVSFSKRCDISPLWSHYGDEHKGFCLGFDSESLIKDSPDEVAHTDFPLGRVMMANVSYVHKLSFDRDVDAYIFNRDKYVDQSITDEMKLYLVEGDISLSSLLLKTNAWAYEREVRLIWADRTGALKFKPSSLSCVIFGMQMKKVSKDKIRQILTGSEWSHVNYMEARQSRDQIGLEVIAL